MDLSYKNNTRAIKILVYVRKNNRHGKFWRMDRTT